MSGRFISCIKEASPSAFRTIWWLAKLMVGVSFVIFILQYVGVIGWLSRWLTPIFGCFGLPGEASLAFVTGYFVNCYSALAVITTLDISRRSITILSVMILCAHNMIVETSVQHKTGSSVMRIVCIRTLSAFFLAFVLNLIMPEDTSRVSASVVNTDDVGFMTLLSDWAVKTLKNIILMVVLVYLLTVLQRILSEFGIIAKIAGMLSPVMRFFGLPPRTAFLWLVANTLGLAYGSAVMIDETERGNTTKDDNDLLNHHIGVSHSNLEDLTLFTAAGGYFFWMLLSRWCMSMLLVWGRRLEKKIIHCLPSS